jgi:hypothetical protein
MHQSQWRGAKHGEGDEGLGPTGERCPDRQRPGRDAHRRHGAVRIGERRGPLTRVPQLIVGGIGRGEKWGVWAGPGKRGNGPSPKEQEDF